MVYGSLLEEINLTGCITLKEVLSEVCVSQIHNDLERLFSLPLEKKLKYKSENSVSPGFTPYGGEKAIDTGIANLLEAWEIESSSLVSEKWPEEMYGEWCRLVKLENYLYNISCDFLNKIEIELGVNKGILSNLANKNESVARYINYPVELVTSRTKGKRQSLHSDMSLLTLNPAATSSGLIASHNGVEYKKNHKGGDVVIMPGLVLEYITGGRIRSCEHTVDTPERLKDSRQRISMPFFVLPDDGDSLSVIESVAIDGIYNEMAPVSMKDFKKDFYDTAFY